MSRVKAAALIGAIMFVAPSVGALAADYVQPVAVGGAWYLRGDIGYKLYARPAAIFDAPLFGGGYFVPGNGELFLEDVGGAFMIGGGVGYELAGQLRVDLTGDYETPGHFYGRLDCPLCGATYSEETADISAWTTLFNFYLDFDSFKGITPYVGAGAGASYLVTSNVVTSDPPGPYPGAGKWNLAWALMAGASHPITENMVVDAAYRFLSLGDAQTGLIDDGSGNTGRIEYLNLMAHEFHFGLRLLLN